MSTNAYLFVRHRTTNLSRIERERADAYVNDARRRDEEAREG